MKHRYRMFLFLIALFTSTLLFGQSKKQQTGKRLIPKKAEAIKTDPSHNANLLKKAPTNIHGLPNFTNASTAPVNLTNTTQVTPQYRDCYTVQSEKKLSERAPGRLSTEAFERNLSARMASSSLALDETTVYKIPTIVHIVHNGEPVGSGSNISHEQVLSQFQVLNEDFRRIGGGYNEHPDGADINIEFVPVLVDPQGNILEEPGVDRVFGYSAYYEYDPIELELKPNTIWDPNRYFNIWVLTFGGGFTGYLGYAQFPSFSGLEGLPEDQWSETDGVVIGYQYFGREGNVVAPFDKGRTASHEVGHWLGLRHIWGDGDCSVDDYCADTPNADGPNRSCDFRDSCPEEGADMVENFMDYSTDACMNIFTNDQKFRIRTVMALSPRRNSLVACQIAPVVQAGTNISESGYAWYQYTATDDEVVTISSITTTSLNTKLSLYRECNTLPMNVSDDAFGTTQSQLSVSLEAGETIKILWESSEFIEPFEWALSTSANAPGAACELATTATEGENHVPVTTLDEYWFTFSPAASGQKIHINTGGKGYRIYKNTCEQLDLLKSGNTPMVVYDIPQGENIYIAFDAEEGNFNWTLTTESLRAGEACNDAVTATVGENTIPYSAPFEYWYTYTIPHDGELSIKTIENPDGEMRVTVFRECNGLPIAEASGSVLEISDLVLEEGETVKVLFDGANSVGNATWILEDFAYENGEICSKAITAQEGLNHTDAAPQWFTFTTTKNTNLKISSVGLTDVDTHLIIKRACDGPIILDNDRAHVGEYSYDQAQLVLFDLEPNEKVYILWSEKWSYEGFDWTIEQVDPLPGDNCTTAKQAKIGSNNIPYLPNHAHFGDIFWNKFIVPANGKKITAFASLPVDMAIYANNNCQEFMWLAGDQGKSSIHGLPAGTELVIIWDVAGYEEDFTWQLTVEDIVPGDVCENPIRAVVGMNESDETPIWYDYVMSQAGSLKVKYEGQLPLVIPRVTILDGCEDDATILTSGVGTAFVSGLQEGQHVRIYWTLGYPFPGTKWSLEEIALKQGDWCSDPIPATYGLNHAEYATQWFSFTPATAGSVKISSRAFTFNDTELYVYDGCDGELLGQSSSILSFEDFIEYFQSELTLENIEAGQTLLIKWDGSYSFESFDFEITDALPRAGESCADPLVAVEGINAKLQPSPRWYTFTMPRDGSLSLSSLGYADFDTNLEVYDACDGALLASNNDYIGSESFVYLPELAAGQTVLIHWFNGYVSDHHTYEWRLIVGEPDLGIVCEFPREAQVGENILPNYTSNYFWYSFTVPADNKKLVISRVEPGQGNRMIGVDFDCETSTVYAYGEDQLEVTGLSVGEQIKIFFGQPGQGERQGFPWTLQVLDEEDGDACDKAIVAEEGEYSVAGAPTWYQYTMEYAGNVRVSSLGVNEPSLNTYLEIYDACDGNLIAENDNAGDDIFNWLSEIVLENVEPGQTVWIKWSYAPPFQLPFNWTLSVEYPNNHTPLLEDLTFQIQPKPVNGQVVGTLVALDEDLDPLTYGITAGNEDGAFALDQENGQLTIADATKIRTQDSGRELEVFVTDNMSTTQATVTFDIVTSLSNYEVIPVKAFPNPAFDKIRLYVPANIRVHESYLLDVSGSLAKTNDPLDREISVSKLNQGIYFLKLITDNGNFTIKVAVVK